MSANEESIVESLTLFEIPVLNVSTIEELLGLAGFDEVDAGGTELADTPMGEFESTTTLGLVPINTLLKSVVLSKLFGKVVLNIVKSDDVPIGFVELDAFDTIKRSPETVT